VRAVGAISADDLRRAAARFVDERAFATVVVGNSEIVKPQVEQLGKVEIMGAVDPQPETKSETKSNPGAAKPQPKPPSEPE
jgi:hypothetical protein